MKKRAGIEEKLAGPDRGWGDEDKIVTGAPISAECAGTVRGNGAWERFAQRLQPPD
jgi:hypothetical protein